MLAFNVHVSNTLKFIHVAAAIAWVGSGLFVQYRGTRLRRTGTPEQTADLARDVADSTPWFIGTSLTVLIAGIALVLYHPGFDFGDTWILLGLIGYGATFLTGMFLIRPTAEKLAAGRGQRGAELADDPGADRQDLRDLPGGSGSCCCWWSWTWCSSRGA